MKKTSNDMINDLITEYRDIITRSPLFASLSDKELIYALSLFSAKAVTYKKGEFLHTAGNKLQRFGLVLYGKIQVCSDDIEGNKMIMANVTAGDTFGESLCFLKINESPCYISATENSCVLTLSPDDLYCASPDKENIEMQKRFTAMIATRTLQMNFRIQVLSKLTIREKLLCFFANLVRENKGNTFSLSLSRNDMAAYIGADRSAMSRELSKMKKEGLIDYYKDTVRILKDKNTDG